MTRLRYNGLVAELGSALTSGATAVTFSAPLTYGGGQAVPTITGSDHIPLSILDSNDILAEVVYLTAYTVGASTGTILRGQETTAGVAHLSGAKIVHGPLAGDMVGALQTFTPVLTAVTANPNMGTGPTAEGTWRLLDGVHVEADLYLQYGTTPYAGSGAYRISLPTPRPNTTTRVTGYGWIYAPGYGVATVIALTDSATGVGHCRLFRTDGGNFEVTHQSPTPWTANGQFNIHLSYEI